MKIRIHSCKPLVGAAQLLVKVADAADCEYVRETLRGQGYSEVAFDDQPPLVRLTVNRANTEDLRRALPEGDEFEWIITD